MVIKELLKKAENKFKNADFESAVNEAMILMCHVLKKNKTWLIIHMNDEVNSEEENFFNEIVELRLSHMPIKYILGTSEFMSLEFKVTPDVLIPRPDTEIMVYEILEKFKNEKLEILDLCCGSGCIGISLLKNLPNANVTFVDISDGALKITKENAELHKVANRAEIIKKDILKDKICGNFDIILSNPPYIKYDDYYGLQEDVRLYEPKIALVAEDDGYEFYKKIIKDYSASVKENGFMLLEAGIGQADTIVKLMDETKLFKNIYTVKDYNNIDRITVGGK
ncbi:MAG: peptide chain release factor N(5)-glutamine methyltransferase [Clostridia bacterium]|nr:peptide chain release factor N(5)-glutamine methyltransferase [Clostridia bacterium]